jgi:hypothetical protein
LDYWATSYREAAEYVNTVALANTNIMVIGPGQVADLYVRKDLTVLSDDEKVTEPFDYIITTTRYNFDVKQYPEAVVVHKIERNGMILSVIKKTGDKVTAQPCRCEAGFCSSRRSNFCVIERGLLRAKTRAPSQ